MGRTDFKWLASGLGVLIFVVLFLSSINWTTTGQKTPIEDWLTVAMPRPVKEMILGFTLAGRNVRRELEIVAEKKTAQAQNADNTKGQNTKTVADKGAAAKKAAAMKAREAARRFHERAFRARIIAESERYRRHLQQLEEQNNYQPEPQEFQPPPKKKAENADTNPVANENQPEEEKMDAAAWKSLVLAEPTAENVQKMVKAFQNKELDADSFYEIVKSLIKDNSEAKRKMGLWALASSSDAKGFSLAAHLAPEMNPESQKRLQDYMYGYNNTRTLTILDQVLRSNDNVAAAAAAQVITKAVEKLKAGQGVTNQDQRGSRIQSQGQNLTIANYQRLVPTLQWLSTKQGSTLSQWAQTLLSQLRTNASAA